MLATGGTSRVDTRLADQSDLADEARFSSTRQLGGRFFLTSMAVQIELLRGPCSRAQHAIRVRPSSIVTELRIPNAAFNLSCEQYASSTSFLAGKYSTLLDS